MAENDELDFARIPDHIAIIMDGNGRWARQQEKDRTFGHQAGAKAVHKIAAKAARLGVKYLTLYTFSSENWNRPDDEVNALMGLLLSSLDDSLFMENDIRFTVIGEEDKLPKDVQQRLAQCKESTKNNKRMTMVLALSYSSYWELTETVKLLASQISAGTLKVDQIDSDLIGSHLATSFMPNPDLLIRTGGEYRLSNFLLWQCAYTEFYFCDTFWPDFDEASLVEAIKDFQSRERRFGMTSEQLNK
ncbi:isoprenyl transferase [Bacteroides propionicifaciens]|uniref:isoprenyl transferase n=1 Tax=Bacteroides propionicifaciens TaxID=392838 RepID=UPI00036FA555|nr:isoprenyl transferase [Bacteroides propionicifaciens]